VIESVRQGLSATYVVAIMLVHRQVVMIWTLNDVVNVLLTGSHSRGPGMCWAYNCMQLARGSREDAVERMLELPLMCS
jgi:hypothetical protein